MLKMDLNFVTYIPFTMHSGGVSENKGYRDVHSRQVTRVTYVI